MSTAWISCLSIARLFSNRWACFLDSFAVSRVNFSSVRFLALSTPLWLNAGHRLGCPVGIGAGVKSMQSVGQTGTHNLQPVHSSIITVCISLPAPIMQSTGQALMHSLQPMHAASRIYAITLSSSIPFSGLRGFSGRPVNAARALMVTDEPGGHWLMSASPAAIAVA